MKGVVIDGVFFSTLVCLSHIGMSHIKIFSLRNVWTGFGAHLTLFSGYRGALSSGLMRPVRETHH